MSVILRRNCSGAARSSSGPVYDCNISTSSASGTIFCSASDLYIYTGIYISSPPRAQRCHKNKEEGFSISLLFYFFYKSASRTAGLHSRIASRHRVPKLFSIDPGMVNRARLMARLFDLFYFFRLFFYFTPQSWGRGEEAPK